MCITAVFVICGNFMAVKVMLVKLLEQQHVKTKPNIWRKTFSDSKIFKERNPYDLSSLSLQMILMTCLALHVHVCLFFVI